nr:tripartite tricarboxylate transporter substrate-binding protein [Afipia sp. P52-10]
MSKARMSRRSALMLFGGSLMAPRAAVAQQTWPTRTVRYMNGFPPGGATDTLSRIFCQKMSEVSGQQFIVENKAGAGGTIAVDAIAKAPPDDTRSAWAISPPT